MPELNIILNEKGIDPLKFLLEDFLAETPTNNSCFLDLGVMYVERTGILSY